MTYPEAIQFLHELQLFGTHPGLENTRRLAKLAGNPQDSLRFIHVAGTNGKGSTCAMLESIYRKAGLRVGLFTSPHLIHFGERIQVDRVLMTHDELIRQVSRMQPMLREFSKDSHPTFFEVATVMALLHFAERKCDLVIWETGLGGRLDATNIVTPLASVITNIQMDHQAWLGDTLELIAGEKAGIIKPGVPVVTGETGRGPLEVIGQKALEEKSPLHSVSSDDIEKSLLRSLRLPLSGAHQKLNAAVAIQTVRVLHNTIPVTDQQICAGLESCNWPGRLQVVELSGGRRILLDGAHNLAGAETLRSALQEDFRGHPITLILGILADKDCEGICRLLSPLANRILLTPVKSSRSAVPSHLATACRLANPSATVLEVASLAGALAVAGEDLLVVVAGSLYLIGEAMELLHLSPAEQASESSLNEWGGKPGKK